MQFFTRVLIVLAVLGGLGYGSYAFGKYVLSARLFGPPKNAQTTTTASIGDPLQKPSDADVEIVPAPQPANNSDENETPSAAIKPTATPDSSVEILPSQNSNSGSTRESSGVSPDPTRKPRRRRRRARPTSRPEPRRQSNPQVAPQTETAPPTRTENVDPPARDNSNNDNSNNDAPNVEAPRRNDPVPVPTRRRRERRTDVAPAPNVETPRAEAPRVREPRRVEPRRDTSPVPVPEGARSGGGGSPVPIPG